MKELIEDGETQAAWPVMRLLRPHLEEAVFKARLRDARQEGYRLFAWQAENGEVVGVMGMRILHDLLDGRCLFIDDLVVQPEFRRQGIATKLLEFAKDFARKNGCFEIRLTSGFARKDAHALYDNYGMKKTSYVFRASTN